MLLMLNNVSYYDHFLGQKERRGPDYSHQTSSRPHYGRQDNGHLVTMEGRKTIPEEASLPGCSSALQGVEPTLETTFYMEPDYGERVGEKRAPFSVPVM